MSLIEIKNLSFSYDKSHKVLNNVNLNIDSGEVIGILGHSGSGKSTLVQLIDGLLKPDSGTILFKGIDIFKNPKKTPDFRFKIGLVMQNPEDQLFSETVFKDIAFGPSNRNLRRDEIERCVLEAVDFVGLDRNILNKSPFEISGGEKRRAAIAGVIAMDPDVLILDEPTAGLDPLGRDALLSQIVDYHRVRKNTVLLVSHSMEDIARIADRILVMSKGKKFMLDTTKEVFSNGEKLEKIGLRVPQITKIMMMLNKKGIFVDPAALTLEQGFTELVNYLS